MIRIGEQDFPLVPVEVGEGIVIHPAVVCAWAVAGGAEGEGLLHDLVDRGAAIDFDGHQHLGAAAIGNGPVGEAAEHFVGNEHGVDEAVVELEAQGPIVGKLLVERKAQLGPEVAGALQLLDGQVDVDGFGLHGGFGG